MVSAGRILIMPRGAYDNNTPYEILDLVSYNGSSYVAKGPTKGNLPTDTTYWQLSAYGGNAANVAGNFAVIETTSVATVQHLEGTLFVDENSQFMKATQTINIGDSIISSTNCTPTTVEQLINEVTAYVDGIDSRNRKLHGVTEIAAQTDLHGLALGEYYKEKTTFYVTNAPVGIDNVPSAVFRLTVEAGSQDASLETSPILLTLRTLDGKTYTQGFDGDNWGAWIETANQASTNSAISAVAASVEATQDSIAPVERATATSVHLAGSQLYYNDVLYDVTANISIGDALADGVNIQAAPERITEHFTSQIQTLSTNVQTLSTNVQTLSTNVQTLSTNVQTLSTNVQTLSNEVAPVNTSNTTADRAYTKGEQFSLGGLLCKALTDIANGATLTLNSNYAQVPSLAQQISQAPIAVTAAMCNSKVTPTSESYYCKVGRLCNLNAVFTATATIGGGSSIITSPPTDMRPIGRVNFLMRYGGDWHLAYINTSGQIACNDSIPVDSTVVINVTYASYN